MKKLVPILIAIFAFMACEKDPDLSKLDNEYLVFTNYDKQADFASFTTYYLPDSVMVIGDKEKPEYWTGDNAKEIVGAFVTNMNERGYTRVAEKEDADLGLQVSYIASTHYFTTYNNGYNDPYWWWGYPGYWNSYYWGNWGYWYYPYPVTYSYSTGSLLTDMINLKAPEGKEAKLPVIWNSYISGLLTSSNKVNMTYTVRGINQAFAQSPYVKGNAR